jgi:DNA-binding transcriptional ArsR family regulator
MMAPRWREFREAYPRFVAGVVLGIAVLLLTDLVLAYKRVQYGRDLARMGASMTEAELRRVEAIAASAENRLAIAAELARRQALSDTELHLAVDTGNGLLYLERQGARLREMRVRLARETTVGTPPDTVLLAPPLGKRSVARVVDGSYRWAVPEWVYRDRGLPVPQSRQIPGALGPLAIYLDSGAVLYSRPAVGPLSDVSYVLPGSVRAEAPDLEAIREDLQPGMAVYFH